MASLSEYLRARGLSLDPTEIAEGLDPVLCNEALIREASELWTSKEALIRLVLQARINSIGKVILEKCQPEEVLVLRQAIVELGAIVNDFEGYKAEHGRRAIINKEVEAPIEPPKEGKEGSI